MSMYILKHSKTLWTIRSSLQLSMSLICFASCIEFVCLALHGEMASKLTIIFSMVPLCVWWLNIYIYIKLKCYHDDFMWCCVLLLTGNSADIVCSSRCPLKGDVGADVVGVAALISFPLGVNDGWLWWWRAPSLRAAGVVIMLPGTAAADDFGLAKMIFFMFWKGDSKSSVSRTAVRTMKKYSWMFSWWTKINT